MSPDDRDAFINACLEYAKATAVPSPVPADRKEYDAWVARIPAAPTYSEEAEDAWFELYRLASDEPAKAWPLFVELARRCESHVQCTAIGAGPFTAFLRKHRNDFSTEIEQERERSEMFRTLMQWVDS